MKFKQNKNDVYALGGLCGILAIFIFLLMRGGYLFGSNLDWVNQHAVLPELFRQQFYDTKEFFPSLALQLGGGQNIYYFAYYGLNSPVILLSYFLPFVPMHLYLCVISIIALFADLFLVFLRCRKQHDTIISSLLTAFFLFSGALILHSHRHIMFVIYMPFLLLAFNACDSMLRGGRSFPLILCAFLVLMSSFYFAVGGFLALLLYALYQQKKEGKSKHFLTVFVSLVIAGLCAMVLLLPILWCLLQGRAEGNSPAMNLGMLLPSISTSMYYPYSMGISAIGFLSLLSGVKHKEKAMSLLSVGLLIMCLVPSITYALNGGMYINGKVLIPFLPLALFPMGDFLEELWKNKPLKHAVGLGLCCVILVACEILVGTRKITLHILSFVLECGFVFLGVFWKKRRLLLIPVFAVVLYNCSYYNFTDDRTRADISSFANIEDIRLLLENTEDPEFYRCGNLIDPYESINQVYDSRYYQTSVYSSSENSYYRNFYLNEMYNTVPYRNSVLLPQSDSYLFNQYMGVRYLLTSEDQELYGYEVVAQQGDILLQKSETAFPVGYRAKKLMSEEQYRTLVYPYNVEALMNYAVVAQAPAVSVESKLEPLALTTSATLPAGIRADEQGYIIETEETVTLSLPSVTDRLLLLRFRVSHLDPNKSKDVFITINGSTNKLTEARWKYHNGNDSFEYVLTDSGGYTVEFSPGRYRIDAMEAYTMPYGTEKVAEAMDIDAAKTKGDRLFGTITCEEPGVVMLSIPYDEGYEVFVDGEQQEIILADTAFVAFHVAEGTHCVELRYTAPGLTLGKLLSLFGLLCALGMQVRRRRPLSDRKG